MVNFISLVNSKTDIDLQNKIYHFMNYAGLLIPKFSLIYK
jgi:hypothetical protein